MCLIPNFMYILPQKISFRSLQKKTSQAQVTSQAYILNT